MISIDSVVPTFKQTSDPIEEVFQMQNDNAIETDYSYIHPEPLDVYSDRFYMMRMFKILYMVLMKNSIRYFMT